LSTEEQGQIPDSPPATDTIVLNPFGRATVLPQYVIHEEDRLEYLHRLLSDQATFPKWLNNRLTNQPTLFVGCEIPDWIGRFLVRRTANERLSNADLKQFFFVNSSASQEPALSSFFNTYCREARVQQLPMAPIEFVAELRARWEKLSPARRRPAPGLPDPPELPAPDTPTIFISYLREDLEAAWELRNAITEIGWYVWLDKRQIRPGDAWAYETLATIDSKAVRWFIPVISSKTEQEREGFVFEEWRAAVARSRRMMDRFLVPVTIDGHYDPDGYTRIRKVFPEFKAPDWGHAPCGAPDQTLLALLRDEIRAMRKDGAK
jgi:TIR domain